MLKIRSLTKKFKEKTVLMDVNLDIHSCNFTKISVS